MRHVSVAVALLLALPAAAQDVGMRLNIADRVQYDDNVLLLPTGGEATTANTLSANLRTDLRGPRVTSVLDLGVAHTTYAGNGGTDVPDLNSYRVGGSITHRATRSDLTGRADYTRAGVLETEILDTGATGGDAERVTQSIGGTWGLTLNPRDRLETNATFRDIDFTGEADPLGRRNPQQNVSLSVALIRAVNPRDTTTLRLATTWLDADDPAKTKSQSLTASLTSERRVTPSVTFRLGGGLGVVHRDRQRVVDDVVDPDVRVSTDRPNLSLDLGVTYASTRLNLSATLTQGFSPSARGSIDATRAISGEAGYALSPEARVTFNVDYNAAYPDVDFIPIDGARRQYLAAGPGFTWRFLPAWNFSTGYRFRHREGAEGTASANTVFAAVSVALGIAR